MGPRKCSQMKGRVSESRRKWGQCKECFRAGYCFRAGLVLLGFGMSIKVPTQNWRSWCSPPALAGHWLRVASGEATSSIFPCLVHTLLHCHRWKKPWAHEWPVVVKEPPLCRKQCTTGVGAGPSSTGTVSSTFWEDPPKGEMNIQTWNIAVSLKIGPSDPWFWDFWNTVAEHTLDPAGSYEGACREYLFSSCSWFQKERTGTS